MEDTSGFDESPAGTAAAMEAVKKFGIVKLLLIAIILAGALWFFVLSPKPGTLSISVTQIDSKDPVESVELDLTPSGQKTVTKFTNTYGSASFESVPSLTDLDLQITPPDGYQVVGNPGADLKLDSGKPKSISVTVAQKTALKVTLPADKVSLGTGCASNLAVLVQNDGDSAAPVQLVGDDKLSDVIQSDTVTIGPKSSQTISANLTAPDKKGTYSGKIRVIRTNSGSAFTLEATDPEQLRVNPESMDERATPGESISKQFTIENSGRTGEARDIQAAITGDFQTQLNPQVTFADNAPLKPGQEKIITVQFTAPATEGKTVGVMLITSACQRISIPMQVTVQNR